MDLTDLRPGDAGWIVMRHGALYARDEGYGPAFEALVAEIVAAFLRERTGWERAFMARAGDAPVGSVLVRADPDGWARLRCFLVEPAHRGTGLASRMFDALVAHVRAHDAPGLRLWTHESHRAAGRLYARKGMTCMSSKPVKAFGQPTVEQVWEMPLPA